MSDPLRFLTVRELARTLEQKGVQIGYESLADLLNCGDIANQLQISGGGNAKQIPQDVADILAVFLPRYRQAKGRLPQAPDLLRSFLRSSLDNGDDGALVAAAASALVPVGQNARTADPTELARIAGRAQGLAMSERVLTAAEAAEYLRISVRLLRRTVPPYRRFGSSAIGDRWRLSDLVEVA